MALITLLDLVAAISAKFWSINKNPLLLLATILLFGGAGAIFALSLRENGMAIVNILWIALSAVAVTIAGIFMFKENIALIQMAGIAVVIVGLILINYKP